MMADLSQLNTDRYGRSKYFHVRQSKSIFQACADFTEGSNKFCSDSIIHRGLVKHFLFELQNKQITSGQDEEDKLLEF